MISVSHGWKTAQKQTLLPEMFVEITYTITEPGLQVEAVASANYPENFSDVKQITKISDKKDGAYASLDYGYWGLDGSFSYYDGTSIVPGYVDRNYSTADGTLGISPYPKITIDFEKRHDATIPGLMIYWGDGWAVDFTVTATNANGIVAQKNITGNTSTKSTIWMDIAEYSQITIEIRKWSHPYQRVRCTEIQFGVENVYTKSDLLGYEHRQSADLLSAELPKNEIIFKLRNDDDRWNPDNPTGFEKYLIEQQEMQVKYGMNVDGTVEWIKGGTFWLSEWNTPSNGLEASFTARDVIGFMGGQYDGVREGTLYDVAMAAFDEAGLSALDSGSVRYIVDDSLKNFTVDFSDDGSSYTIAEILQMVAHAGCCVFYQDREGAVRIEPRSTKYSGYLIEPKISYTHPEYEISKPVKDILVEYGQNRQTVSVEVSRRGETQTVNNSLISNAENARRVGNAAKDVLQSRKTISGDFRADLRIDALDNIVVASKYASNILGVTDVTYSSTGGAFRGKYSGRVISANLDSVAVYSNEFFAGEVW